MSGLTYNDYYRYKTTFSSASACYPSNQIQTNCGGCSQENKFPDTNLIKLILPEMTPRGASYYPVLGNKLGSNPSLYLDNTYVSAIELITSENKHWIVKLNCENFDLNGTTISNVGEPMDDQDATTKHYVDSHLTFLRLPKNIHTHSYTHNNNNTHSHNYSHDFSHDYSHDYSHDFSHDTTATTVNHHHHKHQHHQHHDINNYNTHFYPVFANTLGMSPAMYLDNTSQSPIELNLNLNNDNWTLNLRFEKIDLKNSILANAVDPQHSQDVATKHYVDINRLKVLTSPMTPVGKQYYTLFGDTVGDNTPLYMNLEDSPISLETTQSRKWNLSFKCESIDVGGSILKNASHPILLNDLATKHYVDVSGGMSWSQYPATQNVSMEGFALQNTLITYKYDFPPPSFNTNNNTLILSGNNTSIGCWEYQLQEDQAIQHFSISQLLQNNTYSILLRGPCRGMSKILCIGNGLQNVYTSWMEPIHIGPQNFVRLTIYVSDDNSIPVYLISMFAYN